MRLEDKLAYRLLNESNHRVLNQYELYFLIENLFNDNSDKRLNEVDWRYLSDRAKIFAKYLRPMAGKSAQEKEAIAQKLLANAKANEMNKTKDGQPFTFKNSWKNPEYYKQGFRYLFGTIPSDVSTYLRRTKTRTDHILTDKGRARANHLLRKVMNGEKLDPTEITDINLIIGVADTNDPNNNGKRGSGSFAHRDVRTAFEGNPDLQQAMRRRFKDAGYTAISNAEEAKEKIASEERRKRRETLNTTQRRIKRAYMISKLKNDTAKLDLEKEMMDNEKQLGSNILGQFQTMFTTLSADINQSNENLKDYRAKVDVANKQLSIAKRGGNKVEIAKAQKELNAWEAKEKAEDKHRKDLSRYNGNLIQLMHDTVTGRGRDRASMIGIRRLERGNWQPTDTSNTKGIGKKRKNKNKKK